MKKGIVALLIVFAISPVFVSAQTVEQDAQREQLVTVLKQLVVLLTQQLQQILAQQQQVLNQQQNLLNKMPTVSTFGSTAQPTSNTDPVIPTCTENPVITLQASTDTVDAIEGTHDIKFTGTYENGCYFKVTPIYSGVSLLQRNTNKINGIISGYKFADKWSFTSDNEQQAVSNGELRIDGPEPEKGKQPQFNKAYFTGRVGGFVSKDTTFTLTIGNASASVKVWAK